MVHSLANTVLCKSTVTIMIQSIRKTKQCTTCFCFSLKKKKEIEFTPNTWSLIITIEFHDSVLTTRKFNSHIFMIWSMHQNLNEFPCPKIKHIHAIIYLICDEQVLYLSFPSFLPNFQENRPWNHNMSDVVDGVTISCSLFHEQKRMI